MNRVTLRRTHRRSLHVSLHLHDLWRFCSLQTERLVRCVSLTPPSPLALAVSHPWVYQEAEIKSAVDVLLTAYAEGTLSLPDALTKLHALTPLCDRPSGAVSDCAVEALSAGDKASTALLFHRSLEASLRDGECYLVYSCDVICGVAAWLAPGSD